MEFIFSSRGSKTLPFRHPFLLWPLRVEAVCGEKTRMLTTVKKLTCYRLTGNFFKMTSKRVDEWNAVLSAANLRCRVLPRVRPHPDVRTGDSPLSLHNRLLFYYQSAKQATIYAIAKDCASECRTLSSLECYAERSQAYQTLVCSSLVLVCSRDYFPTNTMKAAMAFTMPLAASNCL